MVAKGKECLLNYEAGFDLVRMSTANPRTPQNPEKTPKKPTRNNKQHDETQRAMPESQSHEKTNSREVLDQPCLNFFFQSLEFIRCVAACLVQFDVGHLSSQKHENLQRRRTHCPEMPLETQPAPLNLQENYIPDFVRSI